MAATPTIGHMQEFNPETETVTAYLERFQMFVSANSIADDKLVPTLLTVVGSTHYTLIRGLVSPELPKDKSFDELVDVLKKHYDPEPIIIAERFHFYERRQKPTESIANYLATLRRLASRCEFGAFLSDALRDKLVCGMHSENTQKVLLTKAKLILEKAVEISQCMEATAQQSKELNKGSHRSSPVLTVQTPGKTCGRCGRGNHSKHECKFRNATCHKCGKVGHIVPVCRSKTSGKSPKASTRRAKWLTTADSADSDSASDCPPDQATDEEPQPLFVVSDKASPPYKVKLEVNGHPLEMEVDTGAAVSLAPESAVATLLSTTQLQSSNIVLKTYTGEQIPVKGVMSVDVRYGQQHHRDLKLLIVQEGGPCLLG